jgi:glutamyl-tRNA reductase
MNSTFSCRYVDYRMVSKLALSSHFNQSSFATANRQRNTVALMTCQRAETYTYGIGKDASDVLGDLRSGSQEIEGTEAVLKRLSTISAGADSWFLGEKYIADQVSKAFKTQAHGSPLFWLAQTARSIGDIARQKSGLVAIGDYPDVAMKILHANNNNSQGQILVFGGGMLGQSVARQAVLSTEAEVHLVTRTPKKLKKEITGDFSICNLHHATQAINNSDFSVVIATLGVSQDYADQIKKLIKNPRCTEVVDLSSLPLFSIDDHPSYTHMYDARFSDVVLSMNSIIGHKLTDAEEIIAREVKKALQNMPKLESLA